MVLIPNSSSATSTAVDLSQLPAPAVVETLDFETILAAKLAFFEAIFPTFSALLESDPVLKLVEVIAYQELLLRQRINDAAQANLIAYAQGSDLDNLAAIFGVTRNVIAPADQQAGTPAVLEDDTALRRRVILAPDSYSVAGPASAYVFHALSADGEVLDASASSPAPGEVVVAVLSRLGDGTASPELIAKVDAALSADTVRPLTDQVTVQSATIVNVNITAALTIYPGPDAQLQLDMANAGLDAMLERNRRLGRDITRSAIIAALHVGGVQNVVLSEPADDVIISPLQAPAISARTITIAGFGE